LLFGNALARKMKKKLMKDTYKQEKEKESEGGTGKRSQ
jgi:hypothetical protein